MHFAQWGLNASFICLLVGTIERKEENKNKGKAGRNIHVESHLIAVVHLLGVVIVVLVFVWSNQAVRVSAFSEDVDSSVDVFDVVSK